MLDEGVARPDPAGVVRDRHDRRPARRGEPRAAELVGAPLARRYARALGEDHDPEALLQPLAAAPGDAAQRLDAARAVDRDGAHQREPPAEERDPEQLALEDMDLRREDLLEGERLPS